MENNRKEIINIDESIDYENNNFPIDKIWIIVPTWELITKILTFLPIIIFGIFGNIIILNIIIRNRALRTPTNLLIGNMAAADMATLLISPIMFMINDFYQNYQMGAIGCQLEGFLEGAMLTTGVFNLCAVSYDRLTAIVLPQETRLTICGAKIVMFCTWLTGIIIAIPLAIYRTFVERQWKNFLETYCKENQTILPKYWHVLISVLVWFPLTVMIITYSAIFHKLDRYEKQVLKREHPMCVSYKTKVAKTLFIIVIVFVILRVPFTVLVFLRYDKQLKNWAQELTPNFQILWYTAHYLIFLNAAINPIIYGLNNDNFRRAYNQTPIFSCFFKSKINNQPQPQPQIKQQQQQKHQKPRNLGKLMYGVLQPRDPCHERKIINKQLMLLPQAAASSSDNNNINKKMKQQSTFHFDVISCYDATKTITKSTKICQLNSQIDGASSHHKSHQIQQPQIRNDSRIVSNSSNSDNNCHLKNIQNMNSIGFI